MTTTIIVTDCNKQPIGACERLTIKETRSEDNSTTSVRLEVSRMRLSRARLKETFSDEKFLVATQTYPVHISVLEDKTETIHVHNAWISGIAVSYATDEWILAEGLELEAEYVEGTRTVTQEA